MKELFIGIDVGGTRTKYGLVEVETGTVYESRVQPTEKGSEKAFLQQVCEVVKGFQQAAFKRGSEVRSIGMGIPGFTTENGEVLTTYGSLPFMEAYPLVQNLRNFFSIPIAIDNDARVVCLGEAIYGAGRDHNRVLTLTLGTGVGFGFVVDKKFTEALPFAHMAGNMSIAEEGGDCYCGKKGCLEALVSSTGILRLAEAEGGIPQTLTVEEIFTAATTGCSEAQTVVKKVIGYLHTAIHNYTNLFAPEVVVLGGGIARSLAPHLGQIKGRSYMGPFPGYDFQLAVSDLHETAGMLGAAALAHTVYQPAKQKSL